MKKIILTCVGVGKDRVDEERFEITVDEFGDPEIRSVYAPIVDRDRSADVTVGPETHDSITLRVEAA